MSLSPIPEQNPCDNCGCKHCVCFDYDENPACPHCDEGVQLVCIDDICQGQGWCMHGDGEITCRHCNGTGSLI